MGGKVIRRETERGERKTDKKKKSYDRIRNETTQKQTKTRTKL